MVCVVMGVLTKDMLRTVVCMDSPGTADMGQVCLTIMLAEHSTLSFIVSEDSVCFTCLNDLCCARVHFPGCGSMYSSKRSTQDSCVCTRHSKLCASNCRCGTN